MDSLSKQFAKANMVQDGDQKDKQKSTFNNKKDFKNLKVKSTYFKTKSNEDVVCYNCNKGHYKRYCMSKPKQKEHKGGELNQIAMVSQIETPIIDNKWWVDIGASCICVCFVNDLFTTYEPSFEKVNMTNKIKLK